MGTVCLCVTVLVSNLTLIVGFFCLTDPDPENPEPTIVSECPSPDISQSPSKISKVITLTFKPGHSHCFSCYIKYL